MWAGAAAVNAIPVSCGEALTSRPRNGRHQAVTCRLQAALTLTELTKPLGSVSSTRFCQYCQCQILDRRADETA